MAPKNAFLENNWVIKLVLEGAVSITGACRCQKLQQSGGILRFDCVYTETASFASPTIPSSRDIVLMTFAAVS